MWPIFVKFRSATSEIRRRKKERKKETLVKHKSADIVTMSGGLTREGGNYSDILPLRPPDEIAFQT